MPKEITSTADVIKEREKTKMLYFGDSLNFLKVPRIPTGIFTLDYLTGGGIPESRITEFYGERSSTKSTVALKVIDSFLKKYPDKKAVFMDYELTFDPDWSRRYITDMDTKVIVVEPDYGEQGVEITYEFAQARDCGLIVIDSLAMMNPLGISTKDTTEDTMGLHPKLVVKMLRKVIPMMSHRKSEENHLTLLIINQTQSSMSQNRFMSPTIKPGGKMKEFMYSLDIQFAFKSMTKVSGLPAKWEYRFVIQKNKLGLAKREGVFTMLLTDVEGLGKIGDILEERQVQTYARRVGTLTKENNVWKLYNWNVPNLPEVEKMLRDNPELLDRLKADTLKECLENPIAIEEEQRNNETTER
jgi:recombination protein RecA